MMEAWAACVTSRPSVVSVFEAPLEAPAGCKKLSQTCSVDLVFVRPHRLAIRADKITLSRAVRFVVPRCSLRLASNEDHGVVMAKNFSSLSRASSQVMPSLTACVSGCFTLNQPFSRGVFSFLIN